MTANSIVCHVRLIALAIAAVVLSLIVQIAGFVAPGWIYEDNDAESKHTGLWYYVYCLANSGCTHGSTPKDKPEVFFLAYQIEVAIALAAIMLALLFLIVHCVRRRRNLTGELVTFLVVAIICCITSGILAMIAAGTHGYALHQAQKWGFSTIFPYALFLTGLGGVIATLVGLYLVIAVNQIAVVNKYVQNGTPVTHM